MKPKVIVIHSFHCRSRNVDSKTQIYRPFDKVQQPFRKGRRRHRRFENGSIEYHQQCWPRQCLTLLVLLGTQEKQGLSSFDGTNAAHAHADSTPHQTNRSNAVRGKGTAIPVCGAAEAEAANNPDGPKNVKEGKAAKDENTSQTGSPDREQEQNARVAFCSEEK